MLAVTGRIEDLKQVSEARFDRLEGKRDLPDYLETILQTVNMSETRLVTMNNLMTGAFEITNDLQATMNGYNNIFVNLKKTQSQILKQLYKQMTANLFLSDSLIRNITGRLQFRILVKFKILNFQL